MKILGIVGSYRKGGVIDSLVTEALAGAQERGVETEKIYLVDERIEFCTNCRTCTQEAGTAPGKCRHDDDMQMILERYGKADGLVIGAPVNFFNVNAITRRFLERLVCFSYWPWGQVGPRMRSKTQGKKAVVITSSAMPAAFGRLFTGALGALRLVAKTMGARPVASIFVGMVARNEKPAISGRSLKQARIAGRKLVTG